MVKSLQIVSLIVPLNWRYPHQDAGKIYQNENILEPFNSNHLQACKNNIGDLVASSYERKIGEVYQNNLFGESKISYDKPSTHNKRWETFV